MKIRQSGCVYPFLFGFVLGLAAFLIGAKWIFRESAFLREGIYTEATLRSLLYTELDRLALLLYILKHRLLFCVLFYAAFRQKTTLYVYAMISYIGMCIGISICSFIVQFGFGGIFLFLVSLFPQSICYFFAIITLMLKRSYGGKGYTPRTILLILVVITGCVLESYVNSLLMIRTLKLF